MRFLARRGYEVGLAAILLVAAAILWDTASGQSFARDDWSMILHRDLSPDGLLRPHNDQAALLPAIFWRTMLPVFGLDAYAPYLAAHIAASIACAVVVFVYVRRRLGPAAGLAAAALLMLLGPAWETITWPFMIAFVASAAFGVAALLALDRHDRRGDLLAAGLVLLSIAASNVGLAFAIAAGVHVIAARTDWWRRLARVLAAPLALYAVWYLVYRDDIDAYQAALPPQPRLLHLVEEVPRFAFDLFAFGIGALSGLPAGARVTLGALAVIAIVLRLLLPRPPAPAAWAALGLAAAYFGGIAYTRYNLQSPDTSRYAYVSAVVILLLAATLLPRPAPGRRTTAVLLAVAGVAVLANLTDLRKGDAIRNESVSIRASLLGIELARDQVDDSFQPALPQTHIQAGAYLEAAGDFGSPAYTLGELRGLPDPVRQTTDGVLVGALGVRFQPAAPQPPSAAARCARVTPNGRTAALETGGRDGLSVQAGGAPVELRARRFADAHPQHPTATVAPGRRAILVLPRDRAAQPWRLRLTSSEPFSAC